MTAASEPDRRRLGFDWRIIPLFGLTILAMVVLVRKLAGPDAFFEALRAADWGLLVVPLVLLGLNQLLSMSRWILILDTLGYKLPPGRALTAMLATWPMALVTPARASDLLRGLAIRDLAPPYIGAGSVLAEKAIDVQSLCIMALVGTVLYGLPLAAALAAGLLVAEWIVIALLVKRRDLIGRLPVLRSRPEKVDQLLLAFNTLLRRPWRLLAAAATSLLSWLTAVGMVYALCLMTHADVGVAPTLALWPAAVVAGMLPITLAGMGTRDVTFIYLLDASGWTPIREGPLLASTFGYSILGTMLLAVVGLPFAVRFMLNLRHEASVAPAPHGAPASTG